MQRIINLKRKERLSIYNGSKNEQIEVHPIYCGDYWCNNGICNYDGYKVIR